MPDVNNAAFAGKSLNNLSGAPEGVYSGHATNVGRLFYGAPSSMAPGIMEIDVYYAGHWLQTDFLNAGYSQQPSVTGCRLANHSWVGGALDTPEETSEVLRRLDWAVDRDEYIQTVGLTNNPNLTRPLLAAAFNVISAGRADGSHSWGCSAVDEIYTADRVRPDLVVPRTTTSAATPIVAAAAALLAQAGHDDPLLSTDPVETYITNRSGAIVYNAERAEVIRAALAAGADRFTANTTDADIVDYRLAPENCSDNGLDIRYGAGQLNICESYWIIAAGEQNSLEDGGSGAVAGAGFDYDPEFGGASGCNQTATYTLTADASHNLLTAALVWHIKIDGGISAVFDGTAVLHDLNLELYDLMAGETVAQSAGCDNNSEHLWVTLTPGHTYEMRVLRASGAEDFAWDYALAWTTRADADGDLIPDELDNCPQTANRQQIDSDADGYGNVCDCDLDNNGRVDAGDYWRWRMLVTIDPQSPIWDPAVDFNENGAADLGDYLIFKFRYGQTAPFE